MNKLVKITLMFLLISNSSIQAGFLDTFNLWCARINKFDIKSYEDETEIKNEYDAEWNKCFQDEIKETVNDLSSRQFYIQDSDDQTRATATIESFFKDQGTGTLELPLYQSNGGFMGLHPQYSYVGQLIFSKSTAPDRLHIEMTGISLNYIKDKKSSLNIYLPRSGEVSLVNLADSIDIRFSPQNIQRLKDKKVTLTTKILDKFTESTIFSPEAIDYIAQLFSQDHGNCIDLSQDSIHTLYSEYNNGIINKAAKHTQIFGTACALVAMTGFIFKKKWDSAFKKASADKQKIA